MANKRLYQFLYTKQPKLTMYNGTVTFGATGAVASFTGAGVQGVTRLTTGIYQVKLQDNFVAYVGATTNMLGGPSGSAVTDGSLVTNTLYQITTLGTTNWVAAGYDADFTPVVGGVFVATGAGGSGGGTATAIAASNITNIEVALDPASQLNNLNANLGRGAAFILSTYGLPASGQVPAPTNPLSGSRMSFKFWFKDSSVKAF